MKRHVSPAIRAAARVLPATLLAAALALGPHPASAQTVMKTGTATINDAQHEWQKRIKDRLEKRTGGKLTVEVYPAGQLGSIPRMIEGTQLGTIESWIGPGEFLVGVEPRFQVLGAPGLFRDLEHAYNAISDPEFRDPYLALGEDKGLVGVSLLIYGPISYAMRRPVRSLQDFRGQKIRVFAAEVQLEPMRRLGATGVPMPLGEALPALQTGAIDGVRSGLTVFTTLKYDGAAKYITDTQEALITSVAVVSRSWFQRLPAEIRTAILEEGRAIEREIYEWTAKAHEEAEAEWTKRGGEIIRLSDDEQRRMMDSLATVGDDIFKGQPALREMYERLKAAAQRHM